MIFLKILHNVPICPAIPRRPPDGVLRHSGNFLTKKNIPGKIVPSDKWEQFVPVCQFDSWVYAAVQNIRIRICSYMSVPWLSKVNPNSESVPKCQAPGRPNVTQMAKKNSQMAPGGRREISLTHTQGTVPYLGCASMYAKCHMTFSIHVNGLIRVPKSHTGTLCSKQWQTWQIPFSPLFLSSQRPDFYGRFVEASSFGNLIARWIQVRLNEGAFLCDM